MYHLTPVPALSSSNDSNSDPSLSSTTSSNRIINWTVYGGKISLAHHLGSQKSLSLAFKGENDREGEGESSSPAAGTGAAVLKSGEGDSIQEKKIGQFDMKDLNKMTIAEEREAVLNAAGKVVVSWRGGPMVDMVSDSLLALLSGVQSNPGAAKVFGSTCACGSHKHTHTHTHTHQPLPGGSSPPSKKPKPSPSAQPDDPDSLDNEVEMTDDTSLSLSVPSSSALSPSATAPDDEQKNKLISMANTVSFFLQQLFGPTQVLLSKQEGETQDEDVTMKEETKQSVSEGSESYKPSSIADETDIPGDKNDDHKSENNSEKSETDSAVQKKGLGSGSENRSKVEVEALVKSEIKIHLQCGSQQAWVDFNTRVYNYN